MDWKDLYCLNGLYQNELRQNLLGFWLPRCEDKEYGGFLNCYDNAGEHLASYDKYTWSQGRFVWIFSRLAWTKVPMFSGEERAEFLRLARQGADFLMKHCLMGEQDWRCVFLMERDGSPKEVSPGSPLDMSIYADCFAVLGLGMYACASGEREPYRFAKRLYQSISERVKTGTFRTLPYPLSPCYRAHGIPMILDNTARELLRAAVLFDSDFAETLKNDMKTCCLDELDHFVDRDNVLHEIITDKNEFFPKILGQHMNPGHVIEDAWFMLDTAEICALPEIRGKIFEITRKALQNGWDEPYGGLLHFCGTNGGRPVGDYAGVEEETMTKQLSGWGDKLWWPHSEALYTTLRCYFESGDREFLQWNEKLFTYVYQTFPNRNPEVREWKQIRRRDGTPEEKVVALPVKDPFHIMRNVILILELLNDKI